MSTPNPNDFKAMFEDLGRRCVRPEQHIEETRQRGPTQDELRSE